MKHKIEMNEVLKQKIAEQEWHIEKAKEECQTLMVHNNSSIEECPSIWDGFLCWSSSSPGRLNAQACPWYILGFNPNKLATKRCMLDGGWYISPNTNRTWTNYSQCYTERVTSIIVKYNVTGNNNSDVSTFLPIIKGVSQVGYGVSLVTLLIAFCIFATFKRLRCPRNRLHMHLFVSFMLRAFLTLLKNVLFVKGIGLPSDFLEKDGEKYFIHGSPTSWRCKLIVSLWQYFIMANYSWILMEGLYLHNLIFFAVFSDTSSIALFVILGWGLPILFVGPWVLVRMYLEDTLCWTTNDNPYYFQLIKAPTTASILINLVLFLNIVRVLLSKLNASISEETRRYRYRRWAKSTLVLMPLFGVHYAVYLTLSYIGIEGKVELIWLLIDQIFASFQGSFVAVLYCLMNGEVRAELTKKWRRLPSWRGRVDHRASLPLNSLPTHTVKRSYLGAVFSGRRKHRRDHQNGFKRGSNTDTCMSTLVSSVTTEVNTTSFISNPNHPRKSVTLTDHIDFIKTPIPESSLLS